MSARLACPAVASKGSALNLPPLRRLIPAQVFGIFHGMRMRDVFDLVEDGSLWPAFNLATRTDGRRKIHLPRAVLESYEPDRVAPKDDLAQVIASILPPLGLSKPDAATIRGGDLCFRWCCSYKRVMQLVRAGELREVGRHNSVRESPKISWASAAKFLERRVL